MVLVVVDTLRADHLSLHGYARRTSPVLETWRDRAAVFERAYATSPWTLPSFASIYTGMLPSRHSAGFLVPAEGDARHPSPNRVKIHGEVRFFARLDGDVPTLAEILRDAGYATGAVVNNPFLSRKFGIARGFQHYDHEKGGDVAARRADEMVHRALRWIDARSTGPFLLLVHLFDPHMSYDAPRPIRGRYTASLESRLRLPVSRTPWLRRNAPALDAADRRFVAAAYDEEVAFVDEQVGRLLDGLDERGFLDDGLVLVTADHGEELFDHESFGHGHTMFEEQLRVPLLAIGRDVASGLHRKPVSIVDVAPTILEATGIEAPAAMDGVSLWNVLTGAAEPPSRPIYAERRGIEPEQKVVIEWPYKLRAEEGGAAVRLFDLEEDPEEMRDLSESRPDLLSRLGERVRERYRLDSPDGSREPAELDASTIEDLRALGYVD